MTDKRIPVSILTGFLGSGKTTLLNQILAKYTQHRFAIIENELGEIGIDGGLLLPTNNRLFELSSGCICCSVNSDLVDSLQELIKQEEPFDYLLIETTGIADPNAVVQSFLQSAFIQHYFRIDSVVCVVDAQQLQKQISHEAEARKQIALADLLLINKIDKVLPEHLAEIATSLTAINPTAERQYTSYASLSSIDLLNRNAFSKKAVEANVVSFKNLRVSTAVHEYKAVAIAIPGSFKAHHFYMWIENYLFFNSKTVLRVKGIVSFIEAPTKQIVQAVGASYTVEEGSNWEGEDRFCKLVFIGKDLDRNSLEWALHKLQA